MNILFIVREQKLGALKGLKLSIETRQNEMMDFIVQMKEKKQEMKKNLAQ